MAYTTFQKQYDEEAAAQKTGIKSHQVQSTVENKDIYILVNAKNPLKSSYEPQLTEISGIKVNTVVADNLKKLLEKANEDGVKLKLDYGYISYEEQETIFEAEKNRQKENGLSDIRSEAEAKRNQSMAGTSEAQTGLLIKFSSEAEGAFSKSAEAYWLERNCAEFGFVLRYPQYHEDHTSMNYSAQIYRYIGTEHAKRIRSYGMCFEEYHNHCDF